MLLKKKIIHDTKDNMEDFIRGGYYNGVYSRGER